MNAVRRTSSDEESALLGKKGEEEYFLHGRALNLALVGQVISKVCMIQFIANLDNSIVATALPSISADLEATPAQYAWVGASYMLAQVIMSPINGRLSDILGRKPLVYGAIAMIMIFSAMSGFSWNIHALIASRALTGIGGGSMVGLTPIIISDMVPWDKRMQVQAYTGLMTSFAGAAGPVVGGYLSQNYSWRWCFYMNVPICTIALVMLMLTLRLKPPAANSAHLKQSFDFIGLILVVGGAGSLAVGFTNAADKSFLVSAAFIPIICGVACLCSAIVHVLTTKKTAIIPKRLLTHRMPAFFLIATSCQSFMFIPATYLLPQFFQGVKGYPAEEAGKEMIPFSISIAFCGFIVGRTASRIKDVRKMIWSGYFLQIVGYALFALILSPYSARWKQEILTAIMACGIGFAIAPTMLVIQAAVPHEDMAAATSGWVLTRSLGPSLGLALFTALLNTQARVRFERIKGYGKLFHVPTGKTDYAIIHALPQPLKDTVLYAFSASFKTCWMTGAGLMIFALLLTLTTFRQPLVQATKEEEAPDVTPPAAVYGAAAERD